MRWSVPASIRPDPPEIARWLRASPAPADAGHPSVSRVRRVAVSAGSRSPSSRPSPTASRSSIASSVGPISSTEPAARQRANGRRVRARPAMATCDPSGRCSTNSARMSRHAREVISCPSSMAIRSGSGGRDIAASSRPTTVRCDIVADAIALNSSAPTGSRRSIASARSLRKTTGSLSLSSAVSQATGRGVFGRPLDEEARLAVTGWCHDQDRGSVPVRPELAQQPRPAQRPHVPAGHDEPGLEERIEQT